LIASEEVMMSLREYLQDLASDGRRAFGIVDELFSGVITTLRRDPRFRNITRSDLELLFADRRASTERRLLEELRGRVHIDDIGDVHIDDIGDFE
jgi:hypothetical protein